MGARLQVGQLSTKTQSPDREPRHAVLPATIPLSSRTLNHLAEHRLHELGSLTLALRQHVGVDLARRAAVRVAEPPLHHMLRHPGVSAGGSGGATGVVQRDHGTPASAHALARWSVKYFG